MKKVIMVLFLVTVIFGLAACGGTAEYQDSPLPTETEQGAGEISDGNASTNTDQTAPNVVQGTHTQTPPSGEIIAGTVKTIDGMNLTIDTSSVFVANETGQHIASGEPQEAQQEIIRLTEQTVIEVQTNTNGQIIGSRIGTLDDLSLQAVVMVEGEWQGDEFVATTLTIMNF